MPEVKCKTCYGCNRLEDKKQDNINKIKKILDIGEQMKL